MRIRRGLNFMVIDVFVLKKLRGVKSVGIFIEDVIKRDWIVDLVSRYYM